MSSLFFYRRIYLIAKIYYFFYNCEMENRRRTFFLGLKIPKSPLLRFTISLIYIWDVSYYCCRSLYMPSIKIIILFVINYKYRNFYEIHFNNFVIFHTVTLARDYKLIFIHSPACYIIPFPSLDTQIYKIPCNTKTTYRYRSDSAINPIRHSLSHTYVTLQQVVTVNPFPKLIKATVDGARDFTRIWRVCKI